MSDNKAKTDLINELSAVMEALSSVTGQHMEIVLHDLECPESSVIRITNGHISGRKVGSSLFEGPENDMGFTGLLGQGGSTEKAAPAVFNNYRTVGPQGKPFRSSTVVFRDENGKANLSLCFNADYSEVAAAREALSRLMPAQTT